MICMSLDMICIRAIHPFNKEATGITSHYSGQTTSKRDLVVGRYFRLRNVLTNVSLERFVWADVHKTLLAKAWSIAVFVHW